VSQKSTVLPPFDVSDAPALALAAGWIGFTSNGVPVEIGAPVTLTLPAVSVPGIEHAPGVPLTAWVYDPAIAGWVEGPGALAGDGTFIVTADRAGWWMVTDSPSDGHCYTGRIVSDDGIIASRTQVRLWSEQGLFHGTFTTQLDGTFCACGPPDVSLVLDTWMLQPPAVEVASANYQLRDAPGTSCATNEAAEDLGDIVARTTELSCVSGTLDPPIPGCAGSYFWAPDYSSVAGIGEIVVGEDGNPSFCLTLPSGGNMYVYLPSDFFYLDGPNATCAMGACQNVGVQSCE
jgi:hypothetical protein